MIKLDFAKIGQFITKKKLWSKALADFNKSEMRNLAEAILDATEPLDGFSPPYLENNILTIPFRAPLKYRYWQGGQSLLETLTELGASDEIKAAYTPTGKGEGMAKDRCAKNENNETRSKKDGAKGNTKTNRVSRNSKGKSEKNK